MPMQAVIAPLASRRLPYLCVVLALASSDRSAHARPEQIAIAADHCSKIGPNRREQAGHLNDDRTILCFDGALDHYLDLTPVLRLKDRGIAVVRSNGGSLGTATAIADVLWEKDATVVVRDYCLSACANALFVASHQTYVLSNTVVAWHGGPGDCSDRRVAVALQRLYRQCDDYGRSFYVKRGLDRHQLVAPPTSQTRRLFYLALDVAPEKRSVFWMWHPANHRFYFKGRVTYEAYPENQFDVEAIVGRHFRHIRVIYDYPTN